MKAFCVITASSLLLAVWLRGIGFAAQHYGAYGIVGYVTLSMVAWKVLVGSAGVGIPVLPGLRHKK